MWVSMCKCACSPLMKLKAFISIKPYTSTFQLSRSCSESCKTIWKFRSYGEECARNFKDTKLQNLQIYQLTQYCKRTATSSTTKLNMPQQTPDEQAAIFCSGCDTTKTPTFPVSLHLHMQLALEYLVHSPGMPLLRSICLLHVLKENG